MELSAAEWLEVVRRDYLDAFIRGGGAAVKFVVTRGDQARRELSDSLGQEATRGGYQFASVDAAATRLHLMDKLFHELARQLDWDALIHAYLVRLLSARGLTLPSQPEELTLATLAALNGRSETLLRAEVRGLVERELFRDYAMAQAFRIALIRLCWLLLDPEDDPALRAALKEWLRGELRLVSAVKRAPIFQKIARHNARFILFSLTHWLTLAGRSGLVLTIDASRYALGPRGPNVAGGPQYSLGAALDAYELLRQLVDATDDLEHAFVVVLMGSEFLTDDRRGLRGYPALYYRVADEVRDRERVNPLAALVRLEAAAAAGAAG
jgi:hypothetical protein